ncbi:TPA: twin-arginine translocase TatA/TatE family subunit [Candidatus Beckwithbacteria bacterium]|nr:MAG: twiN-arginine translocation protein, tata/e family subunit, sec-independent protein translocase protein TatA [Candidatus Beckwithbacteria bacterium GW2011_GWC1_49_16]KKU35181.1 MAG: Sec-independent protein translocase protein TatA [Candidatus Beckwithbacteria bacterium GW2011_GWA1_46_30]KKU71745.1 MAG: Sec-independent protein translocase protein TatA [Candidatus Beckwithbacteria bacterium GW2011_GWA2_47_25]KKW03843.1 MAG: Sec-independent protein translocase protein TatA [Candidatus Beckw
MFANIGLGEIIVIALVLMLFFGGDKLPELARGIRRATNEFRRALNENDSPPTKSKKNKS